MHLPNPNMNNFHLTTNGNNWELKAEGGRGLASSPTKKEAMERSVEIVTPRSRDNALSKTGS
jgi:hypothetical protein